MVKPLLIFSLSVLLFAFEASEQKKDFGNDGRKGLSAAQLGELAKGEVVIISKDGKEVKGELIEAAIVFNAAPDTAWRLISKTDDQPKYISQCKEIKVTSKTAAKAQEVHTVGTALVTWKYGVIENYAPENKYLYWTLDPSYKDNDLVTLNGYWQLYPYDKGKTLARYGSKVSFKKIPEFVENMFKKGGVKDALTSVKKYVDSEAHTTNDFVKEGAKTESRFPISG